MNIRTLFNPATEWSFEGVLLKRILGATFRQNGRKQTCAQGAGRSRSNEDWNELSIEPAGVCPAKKYGLILTREMNITIVGKESMRMIPYLYLFTTSNSGEWLWR